MIYDHFSFASYSNRGDENPRKGLRGRLNVLASFEGSEVDWESRGKLSRLIDFLNHSSRTDAIDFLNTKKIFFKKKSFFCVYSRREFEYFFFFSKKNQKYGEKREKALLSRFDDLATFNFIFDTVSNFQCDV